MDTACTNKDTPAFSNPYINNDSLCFIDRLTVDTLQSIFIECASDYFRENSHRMLFIVPHWVNVSYVSRHWRNVALNCPTLWTYLFTLSPRWTEELLTRSKQASLKICVHLDSALWCKKRTTEAIINHVERVQELRIHFFDHDYASGFLSKLSSPAPRLRHLAISHVYTSISSPQLPFNGDTPVLRTLELTWDRLNLSSLTHLSLCDIRSQFQQNITDFLAMLRGMENLQGLHLKDALTSATAFISSLGFHSFQKIDLPHLSIFYLRAPLSTVAAMLSCTNIPLTTPLKLESHLGINSENSSSLDHLAPLCHCFMERYAILQHQTQTLPRIRSLVIADTGDDVQLGFSTDAGATNFSFKSFLSQECDNDLLRISLRSYDQHHIVTPLLHSMPLSTVQSIRVNQPSSSMTLWTDILRNLPDLRYLKLSSGTMPNLVPILSLTAHNPTENHGGEDEQGHNDILVPALQALELDNIQISASLAKMTISPDVTTVQSLLRALSARKLQAQGRLTMTRCVHRISKRERKLVDLKATWGNGYWGMLLYKEDLDVD